MNRKKYNNIPHFTLGKTEISQIPREELKEIMAKAIKIWHFEKGEKGLIPIEGEYDSTNPKHVKVSDVVKVYP